MWGIGNAINFIQKGEGSNHPLATFFMQIWNVKMAESLLHSFFYLKLFHFLFY